MPHSVNNSTSTRTRMSRPSSTSTQGAVFPQQAGAQLLSPETAENQPLSPSPSQFSFASSPHHEQLSNDGPRGQRPMTMNRGPTVDSMGGLRPATSRSRAQYYEDSLSYKDGMTSSARDRVTKDAPIVAELRTNVIIKDEYTLVTDLSHHLSTRYQRPESSIMITVNHSACLLLGGTFEPTYVLTINALPVQLQPTTNKRNAALMQQFMCESIGVTSDRGIIKFIPIQEESLAINGMTILGEIERLERQHAEENGPVKRAITKGSRRSGVFKTKSSIQLSRNTSKAEPVREVDAIAVKYGPLDSAVAINDKALESSDESKKSEPLMSKFSKKNASRTNLANVPPPPPIPQDEPTPRIAKRKSFMSVFRR